jgi:pyruvate kinase
MMVIIPLTVVIIPENTGCDAILLGAETQRGSYPVEAISMVCKICAEVCFLN